MQCEICKKILPVTRENGKWVCVQYCLSDKTKNQFFPIENQKIGNIEINIKEE